jgi:hypothetical protein
LFVCLFLPSWAFHKPQTSFACIWKVHVGIVNSVVHHPNTQSVSLYSSTNTYIIGTFFSKLKNFWTEFENQVIEFHCTTRHTFFKTA